SCRGLDVRRHDGVEPDEADHPVVDCEHAADEGFYRIGGDFGHRLNRVDSLAQIFGDRIDQQSDELIFDLHDDDDVALGGPGTGKAEALREIDDRQHRAAQIYDAAQVWRGVRQGRGRRPASNLPHRHDVDAELLCPDTEGDEFVCDGCGGCCVGHDSNTKSHGV